jgi:hypothetical protein
MRRALTVAAWVFVVCLGSVGEGVAADCPEDSVLSGTVCIDKYEASLWYVPPEQKTLIRRIQRGTVRHEHLLAGGATHVGLSMGDLADYGCPITGNGCVNVYAVSIPGVTPSRWVSWFQAVAIARNSLKRLPTNQEWQAAALGSPDSPDGPCQIDSGILRPTGAEPDCVSDVGAFDMPGNSGELVAEWGDLNDTGCTSWPAEFSSDLSCFGGSGLNQLPGAFLRSGYWGGGTGGVFTVRTTFDPTIAANTWGFRGVR